MNEPSTPASNLQN